MAGETTLTIMEGGAVERLLARVDVGDCWHVRTKQPDHVRVKVATGHYRRAHRLVYETLVGPIPDGLVLDHLCKNVQCVNPDHLEPVTQAVNLDRSAARDQQKRWRARQPRKVKPEPKRPAGRFSNATRCIHGHEFTPENTQMKPNKAVRGGYERVCRTCRKVNNQKQAALRKAARHSARSI